MRDTPYVSAVLASVLNDTPQHTATHCNTLQRAATRCHTLHYTRSNTFDVHSLLLWVCVRARMSARARMRKDSHTHRYTNTRTHTHTATHMSARILSLSTGRCVGKHAWICKHPIYTYLCVMCVCARMILCVLYRASILSVPTGMYVCIFVCMHPCMYVCTCVYMHICMYSETLRALDCCEFQQLPSIHTYARMYVNTQDTWG